ncbi:MAG: lactate racemase domain-containing protein, partial [bacterium]
FKGRIYMHDPDDDANLVRAGITRLGHEVRLNRRAFETRRLILTGTVTYHYHAGFGGGRKSLVPGLAGRQTIAHNHSLSLDLNVNRFHPHVHAGSLAGNPVAGEMLEGARMRAPDFIINTVLTPDNQLAGVFAGDLEAAHAAACRYAEGIYRCDISERADFVVASAEGSSNWIQAHKALYNADLAVKQNGRIVLFAPCQEGLGNERFRHWVTRPTLDDLFDGLRKSPEVNGQTALSSRLRGAKTILVTSMGQKDRTDLGIETAPDLESAIRKTVSDLVAAGIRKPVCYTMPEALFTVPFIAGA